MISLLAGYQKVAFWILFVLAKEQPRYVSRIKLMELLYSYHYSCDEEIGPQVVLESLRRLRESGLVRTKRGRGYKLGRSTKEISVSTVLDSLLPKDFRSSIKGCPAYYLGENCPIEDKCHLTKVWLHIHNVLIKETEKFTLDEFLK